MSSSTPGGDISGGTTARLYKQRLHTYSKQTRLRRTDLPDQTLPTTAPKPSSRVQRPSGVLSSGRSRDHSFGSSPILCSAVGISPCLPKDNSGRSPLLKGSRSSRTGSKLSDAGPAHDSLDSLLSVDKTVGERDSVLVAEPRAPYLVMWEPLIDKEDQLPPWRPQVAVEDGPRSKEKKKHRSSKSGSGINNQTGEPHKMGSKEKEMTVTPSTVAWNVASYNHYKKSPHIMGKQSGGATGKTEERPFLSTDSRDGIGGPSPRSSGAAMSPTRMSSSSLTARGSRDLQKGASTFLTAE
eukprot:GHVN01089460.1.p1 GENE.GHVN01089460.1~~GHVN01089460.1.p1  ORF type:complete len:324 (-),score=47.81 GHVN01089460.1:384-1271(-)